MKKMSGNSIANIVAAVLMLIALIVVEVSFQTAQGWFDTNNNPVIIALAVIGIVLLLAITALNISGVGGDGMTVSVLKTFFTAGACACAGVMVGLVLGDIVTEFAFTFFSNFNQGTAKEYFMPTACMQAVAGMVLCIITILAAAAANAFDAKKE